MRVVTIEVFPPDQCFVISTDSWYQQSRCITRWQTQYNRLENSVYIVLPYQWTLLIRIPSIRICTKTVTHKNKIWVSTSNYVEGQSPQDRRRQLLVVRGRKEADSPPPLHGVPGVAPADQAIIERRREGLWVEAPKSPFGQETLEGQGHRGGAGFLGGVLVSD